MRERSAPIYHSEHIDASGLAVWLMRGPVSTAEWRRHLEDIDRLRGWTHLAERPCAILDVDDFSPTAVQRAELAQHTRVPSYRPNLAFVTSNHFARAALRAIAWLQSQPPYRADFFARPEEAMAWLEAARGAPLSALREAHARARHKVGVRPARPAR